MVTNKVFISVHCFMALLILLLVILSNIFNSQAYLIYNRLMLEENFTQNGIFFIQVFSLLYCSLLAMYMFFVNDYDIYFIKSSPEGFYYAKVCTLWLMSLYFLLVSYGVFLIILYNYPFDVSFHPFVVFLYLLFFLVYYIFIFVLIDTLDGHFMLYFLPFILFLISVFSSDQGILKEDVTGFAKGLYVFIYDLVLFDQFGPYYPVTYYLCVVTLSGIVFLKVKENKDFLG